MAGERSKASEPAQVGAGSRYFASAPAEPTAFRVRNGCGLVWLRPKRDARPWTQQETLERLWPMTAWLLDTGPLVAFFDRSEEHHAWTTEKWAHAPVPMVTCDAVLAEAAYLLQERAGLPPEKFLTLFERKVITAPFSLAQHSASVSRLLEK